jgi:hypothetical protein
MEVVTGIKGNFHRTDYSIFCTFISRSPKNYALYQTRSWHLYEDVQVALNTFVKCLEFTIVHEELNSDNPFCVLNKDGLSIMVFQNKEYAEKAHPEIRLVTNNNEEVYQRVATQFPELLHPNLSEVTLRPWGAKASLSGTPY